MAYQPNETKYFTKINDSSLIYPFSYLVEFKNLYKNDERRYYAIKIHSTCNLDLEKISITKDEYIKFITKLNLSQDNLQLLSNSNKEFNKNMSNNVKLLLENNLLKKDLFVVHDVRSDFCKSYTSQVREHHNIFYTSNKNDTNDVIIFELVYMQKYFISRIIID